MKVAQLIELLKDMPPDAQVCYLNEETQIAVGDAVEAVAGVELVTPGQARRRLENEPPTQYVLLV